MNTGYADVLVGLQYGDEGKAKVVDFLAPDYDIIARFNGGPNAGHSLEHNGQKIALKQIPSGIFYPNMKLYIGSGCVLNLFKLLKEVEEVNKLDISLENRLFISGNASVIQPHHIILDGMLCANIGTTKNGIGPCYADRALRMVDDRLLNLQFADFLSDPKGTLAILKKNLQAVLEDESFRSRDASGLDAMPDLTDPDAFMVKFTAALEKVAPYITSDPLWLLRKVKNGEKVLFEGAQSTMLDVTRGSVPYVTSSNTVASQAYVGGDLPPNFHRKTVGVAKVIMSRVGNGPFISEFGGERSEEYCGGDDPSRHNQPFEQKHDTDTLLAADDEFDVGIALRMLANEYGTGTKRPRRIGRFDLVQLSHAARQNHVDVLYLNKCDLLDSYSRTKQNKIPVVTSYEIGDEVIDYVPIAEAASRAVKAVYTEFDAFSEDVNECRKLSELPEQLRSLITAVEKATEVQVVAVGVGPDRKQNVTIVDWQKQ